MSKFGLKVNGSIDIKDVFSPIQNRIGTIGQKKQKRFLKMSIG